MATDTHTDTGVKEALEFASIPWAAVIHHGGGTGPSQNLFTTHLYPPTTYNWVSRENEPLLTHRCTGTRTLLYEVKPLGFAHSNQLHELNWHNKAY